MIGKKRRTCEQWNKQGKGAIRRTRLVRSAVESLLQDGLSTGSKVCRPDITALADR